MQTVIYSTIFYECFPYAVHLGYREEKIWTLLLMCIHSSALFFFFFSFLFLAAPCGMRDLSSPTRDRTRVPCIGSAES